MLKRLWRGWTRPENADAYEQLLRSTIFPGIMGRKIDGFLGIELLRRPVGTEIEFMTIMTFTDQAAVVRFAGPQHETAVVPAAAQLLLSRYDDQAAHYELRIARHAQAQDSATA
ncbi:antibiotic biosynthesis monooxygenase [Bradyrhizobium sp. HKCCYLS2038]|uniref:antibiotic biosynthesis monooxygenase n=1 Tax=unclassified Bradyrhizobium TaxID=2631580 RepID=UPI003EBAB936